MNQLFIDDECATHDEAGYAESECERSNDQPKQQSSTFVTTSGPGKNAKPQLHICFVSISLLLNSFKFEFSVCVFCAATAAKPIPTNDGNARDESQHEHEHSTKPTI